jgi:hypothetical protein|tara:strand:+ start:17 stop:445 length:429 start_codon:yes stop_codon:yes gene_type:complete
METSFKSRAFPFVFWIMIIVLLLDTYDTFSREVIGYFKGSIPLTGDINIEPDTFGLFVSVIQIILVLYGIYLLFKKKKVGGYWVVGVNFVAVCVTFVAFFLGFTAGPPSEYLSQLFLFISIWFIVLCLVAIGIPRLYSEKFD